MPDVTLLTDLDTPGDLTIAVGSSLYLNGFNLTVGGTLTINGRLIVQGAEIITINSIPINVNKLDVHTAVALGAVWGMEFRGPGNVTVTDYSTIFFDLIPGTAKLHLFQNGLPNEITINGNFSTTGTLQVPATLRSTADGQEWFVILNGMSTLSAGVDVKDSNADNGITIFARDSIDSGNTTNWNLTPTFNQSNSTLGNATWEDILFKLRTRLNEPEPAFWTDEQLMCYFNETQLYFARETRFRKVEQTFDIIETTFTPTSFFALLPQDFLGILSAATVSNTDALDMNYLRFTNVPGRSKEGFQDQGFFLKNRGEVHLVRPVDTAALKLFVTFYAAPIPFSDPEELDALTFVFDEYLEDVIIGTVATALLQNGRFEEYQFLKREFDKRVKEAYKAEGRRTGNKQMVVMK